MGFTDGFYKALGYFLGYLWMWGMFTLGKQLFNEYQRKLKTVVVILGVSSLLAFLTWGTAGTHIEDSDPYMGGGETVTDYHATNAQRNKDATLIFLLSFPSGCAGLGSAARSKRSKSGDEHKS